MGWVSTYDYDRSQPDPLDDSMAEIIQHMNGDHKDALVLLARQFAHVDSTEATMTTVDRLGFHVRLKTAEGMRGARIAFLREVSSQGETRKVLVEMVQQGQLLPIPPCHHESWPLDKTRSVIRIARSRARVLPGRRATLK